MLQVNFSHAVLSTTKPVDYVVVVVQCIAYADEQMSLVQVLMNFTILYSRLPKLSVFVSHNGELHTSVSIHRTAAAA